jgi:ATP-dependent Zn protease
MKIEESSIRAIEVIAYHEAGHAVACFVLNEKFTKISIESFGEFSGHIDGSTATVETFKLNDMQKYNPDRRRNLTEIFLAGGVAEIMLYEMKLKSWGWELTQELKNSIDQSANRHSEDDIAYVLKLVSLTGGNITGYIALTRTLLEKHRKSLDALAGALQERGELSSEEVTGIIKANLQ